jgi:hypothetical protein
MSLALETVCAKLAPKLTDDPATRLVASKVIELAQRGVRDATTLSTMTLKELSHLRTNKSGSFEIFTAIRRAPLALDKYVVGDCAFPRMTRSDGCANRRPPVSFKALIRRGSRLAVMHANNDPLGVRSAYPFSGGCGGKAFCCASRLVIATIEISKPKTGKNSTNISAVSTRRR